MSPTYSSAIQTRRISRRYTTLEGWREIGNGVYITGTNLQVFAVKNQLDPEAYNDDYTAWTSCGTENGSIKALSWDSRQDRAVSPISEQRGTIVDGGFVKEERYHVFEMREKWIVIAMIGVAGLFSGLSSNIFFPSLDAISEVRSYTPFRCFRRQYQGHFAEILPGNTTTFSRAKFILLPS